jgi:GT2 family glycosyltransferase
MSVQRNNGVATVRITAIVTAYKRIGETLATLKKIYACQPAPDEILVHVDGSQSSCEEAIRQSFPFVKLLRSHGCVGPGGGRNKLIAEAKNEFVASFDDDSFPIDPGYFARLEELFTVFPNAAVISAAVYHPGESIDPDTRTEEWVSDFSGGACGYRRSAFLTTTGYVPLTVAYGMEEVDLALRLHSRGGRVLRTRWLRVFHDTDLKRHADPRITAASIANLALLSYLRYPPSYWLVGFGQCLSRIVWLLRHGRSHGIFSGLAMIPAHLRRNKQHRQVISAQYVRSYLALRRMPIGAAIE